MAMGRSRDDDIFDKHPAFLRKGRYPGDADELHQEIIKQGEQLMTVASELRAAIVANDEATKRIEERVAALAARMAQFDQERAALEAEKAALADKVAAAEAEKLATDAELAELKTLVEGDTAEEDKIAAPTSGGSTGGIPE